jgi:hypothetical protein
MSKQYVSIEFKDFNLLLPKHILTYPHTLLKRYFGCKCLRFAVLFADQSKSVGGAKEKTEFRKLLLSPSNEYARPIAVRDYTKFLNRVQEYYCKYHNDDSMSR